MRAVAQVMLMTDEMLKGTTRHIPGLKRFLNECGFQTIKQVLKGGFPAVE